MAMTESDGHWLRMEFERSRLPRSALAGYLGLDNAAISRLVSGERGLSKQQEIDADAFFSIACWPQHSEISQAAYRLRDLRVRTRAMRTLSAWLRTRGEPTQNDPYADLLPLITEGVLDLRADQIIALSMSERLDLPMLVSGNDVPKNKHCAVESPGVRLSEWARSVARRPDAVYNFGKGISDLRGARARAHASEALGHGCTLFRPTKRQDVNLGSYRAYIVPDDSLVPWFDTGQVLFVANRRESVRRGDRVLLLKRVGATRHGDEISRASIGLVGRYIFDTEETICIETPAAGQRDLNKRDWEPARRIALCTL